MNWAADSPVRYLALKIQYFAISCLKWFEQTMYMMGWWALNNKGFVKSKEPYLSTFLRCKKVLTPQSALVLLHHQMLSPEFCMTIMSELFHQLFLGIVTGLRNLRVSAMGWPRVWVQVGFVQPSPYPYPSHGLAGLPKIFKLHSKMSSTVLKLVTIAFDLHHYPLHCVGTLKHKKKVSKSPWLPLSHNWLTYFDVFTVLFHSSKMPAHMPLPSNERCRHYFSLLKELRQLQRS